MNTATNKCTWWLSHSQTHTRTRTPSVADNRQLTPHAGPFPLSEKVKMAFQVSHCPSHFICHRRLVQGWNGTKIQKKWGGEQRLGRVQFKFVVPHVQVDIYLKKKCYKSSRTPLLSTRQIQGRPRSLMVHWLKREKIANWQDSSLPPWHDTWTPLLSSLRCVQLIDSLCHSRRAVSLRHNVTGQTKVFVLCLFWQKSLSLPRRRSYDLGWPF